MKTLLAGLALAASGMLFSRLLASLGAHHSVSLDGLATLELPLSFHLADSPEQQLPPARRLLRRPYLNAEAFADRLTYYLPSHERQTFGGKVVPVVLRVTLYAADAPLPDAPDSSYLQHLGAENYHYDSQQHDLYAQATPVGEHLYYVEQPHSEAGWFSTSSYRMQHFFLTDPTNRARLFLSADDRELPRPQAELLLRAAQRSLRRDPAALAGYFAHASRVVCHRAAVEQANLEVNLAAFNQQLAAAGLPPLPLVARYANGRYVEAGSYFYGLNSRQQVFFAAWLGGSPPGSARVRLPAYFSYGNGQGLYLPSFQQVAVGQQRVPAGYELRLRSSASEPLWFPPEEFARFQLTDLQREAAESAAQAQRAPGGVPPTPPPAPVRWELSQASAEDRAELGTRTKYQHRRLRFGSSAGSGFLLSYLGQRTTEDQPTQAVFVLETLDGSIRYHPVAADAQYLAVDAAQGGTLMLAVAGHRYQARIEPPAQGYLTVVAE